MELHLQQSFLLVWFPLLSFISVSDLGFLYKLSQFAALPALSPVVE